jgi:hypothetical protein
MDKGKKSGNYARMGLILAIAKLFGAEMAYRKVEQRKKYGFGHHKRGARGKGHAAGFKLVKKMARRPDNLGWVKLHPKPTHSGKNRGNSTLMSKNTEYAREQ